VKRAYSLKLPESWIRPGKLLIERDGEFAVSYKEDEGSSIITLTKVEQSMWILFLEAHFSDLGKKRDVYAGSEGYNIIYLWCSHNSSELHHYHLYLLVNELLQMNSREMLIDLKDNARKTWSLSEFPNCIWNSLDKVISITKRRNNLLSRRAAYLQRYYIPTHGYKTMQSLAELWFSLCIEEILEFITKFFCNEYFALFLSDNFPLVTDLKLEIYKILKDLFVIDVEKIRVRDVLKDLSHKLT